MNQIKIIAEIGWNHMGDMHLASKMIEAAATSGATHVKFQTWSVSKLKNGPWDEDGRKEIYQKAELSKEDHIFLLKECQKHNVKFLTSCFSSTDVLFISTLTNEIKIPSTEIANQDLLDQIIECFKSKKDHHVYLSTGASTWNEVEEAVKTLSKNKINFTLMHCVSAYPTPANMCNMNRINDLKKLHFDVGYSGHYHGIDDAIVAIELGATAIEKHFTIDNELPGRDNKFALLPASLKLLCQFVEIRKNMLMYHGINHLDIEENMRNVYRGRWDSK